MGKLTDQQKDRMREFLVRQGLSFKPLQDEMVDHMSCELEDRMSEGLSFQEAWNQAVNEIPENHFQTIQQEVMSSIHKRFTWSQAFSFSALALIFIATLFKILHLQFAGEALLLSFGFLAASLLSGSLSGVSLNRQKKGAVRVYGVVAGVIMLLIAFSFKLLHLTGADQLMILAVGVLLICLVLNSFYVYGRSPAQGNMLTFLHEKYTPAIERFLLILLFPVVAYKAIAIFMGTRDFLGNIVLLVLIFAAGLQLIVLSWRIMEDDTSKRNVFTLTATIVCGMCFILPFLGPVLPLSARIVLVALFSPVAGWLAYTLDDGTKKPLLVILPGLVSAVFLGWALMSTGLLPVSYRAIFFNVPVFIIIVIGVLLTRKHGAMRTYMLVSLGGFLFEYMM